MDKSKNRQLATIFVAAVLFLSFLGLLTDFIAGIYAYGVLGSGVPLEMILVVLFLSPFGLLLFKRGLPPTALIILAELVLLCRLVALYLPTRYQLMVSGLGVGLFLVFFPALLWDRGQKDDAPAGPLMSAGLLLASAVAILLRTLAGTMDLSSQGWFTIIAWLLAGGAAVLLPGLLRFKPRPSGTKYTARPRAGWLKLFGLAAGILSVFSLLYFGFAAPGVIARWTGESYLLILALAALALILFAWLLVAGKGLVARVTGPWALVLTAGFSLALTGLLAVNQVGLPKTAEAYPLSDPAVSPLRLFLLVVMLLLFPILFLDFGLLVEETILTQPSMRRLGLAFGLGGLVMLLLVLANVFTSVWAYIDPILEPISEGRFPHVHLIAGLILTLSLLAVGDRTVRRGAETVSKNLDRLFAGLVTALGLLVIVVAFLAAPNPATAEPGDTLFVAGYNLHQGYDAVGQRSHQEQCALLQELDADILALSETDTARIAGGNFDIVQYLAECLDMYVYAGPKTGIGSFGYALLAKYPIENPETYHLLSGPGLPSVRKLDKVTSGDQVAVIKGEVQVGDQTFTIFVNHFDSNPPLEQPQGLAELATGLDRVIAIGDYNCEQETECFELITAALDYCAESSNTPAAGQDKIDHIFISGDLSCPAYSYVDSPASDHPVVTAVLSWSE